MSKYVYSCLGLFRHHHNHHHNHHNHLYHHLYHHLYQISFSVLDTRPLQLMAPAASERGVKLLCYGVLLVSTSPHDPVLSVQMRPLDPVLSVQMLPLDPVLSVQMRPLDPVLSVQTRRLYYLGIYVAELCFSSPSLKFILLLYIVSVWVCAYCWILLIYS